MSRILAVRLLAALILVSAIPIAGQTPGGPRIVRQGSVAGESGVLAIQDDLITMYSDGDIFFSLGPQSKSQMISNQQYLSLRIGNGMMRRTMEKLPISLAHEYPLCDAMNQIDIRATQDGALLSLLPVKAKIKSVGRVSSSLLLIVYSTNANTIRHSLRLALMRRKSYRKYTLLKTDLVTQGGEYCGMDTLGQSERAILVDEPSGSSDYSAAYFYAIAQ